MGINLKGFKPPLGRHGLITAYSFSQTRPMSQQWEHYWADYTIQCCCNPDISSTKNKSANYPLLDEGLFTGLLGFFALGDSNLKLSCNFFSIDGFSMSDISILLSAEKLLLLIKTRASKTKIEVI